MFRPVAENVLRTSAHYPTRNNRIQRILEGRNFESGLRFAFLHSLDPTQSEACLLHRNKRFQLAQINTPREELLSNYG
jgi:hypothetical protein